MSNTISFKHSGNSGDIIYALAGIKHVCAKYKKKATILIWNNQAGYYYEGAKHPLGNLMMNDYMYGMMRPLLLGQEYIEDVQLFDGQIPNFDLDRIRQDFVNMPYGNISRWYSYIFPEMACDLGNAWLSAPARTYGHTIMVNRTDRYRNAHISYGFLRNLSDHIVFVGTEDEFVSMKKDIPQLVNGNFDNFMSLAEAIAGCKFFVGNQSMCYAIAEALKVPRIVELCSFAPNVIPAGPGPGYDYFTQRAFEYYAKELARA